MCELATANDSIVQKSYDPTCSRDKIIHSQPECYYDSVHLDSGATPEEKHSLDNRQSAVSEVILEEKHIQSTAEPQTPDTVDDILSVFFASPPHTRNYIKHAKLRNEEKKNASAGNIHHTAIQDEDEIRCKNILDTNKGGVKGARVTEETTPFVPIDSKENPTTEKKMRLAEIAVCPEMETFSQSSQNSMNVLCNAVDKTETSGIFSASSSVMKTVVSSEYSTSSMNMSSFDRTHSQKMTRKQDTPKTPKFAAIHHLHLNGDDDFMFSQMSPSIIDSIFKATATSTPLGGSNDVDLKEVKDVIPIEKPLSPVCCAKTPVRWKEHGTLTPSVEKKEGCHDIDTFVPRACLPTAENTTSDKGLLGRQAYKGVGLGKKKVKRFSYPTSDQVGTVCPRTIFKFGTKDKWKQTTETSDVEIGNDDNKTKGIRDEKTEPYLDVAECPAVQVDQIQHQPTEKGDGSQTTSAMENKGCKLGNPYQRRFTSTGNNAVYS